MAETGFFSLSTQAIVIAAVLAGIVIFAAVKLVWGISQWSRKSDYRIGQRWGGEHVDVVEWAGKSGYVRAGGELWRAVSEDALAPGDRVKVAHTDGLILDVRKV